jgi:molybdopterin/thiamine biosynthesis adenylyltransferase
MAGHFKDLIAWQKAMDLVNAVYDATDAFPKRETYNLTDQIRRATVSIPSNIAEGQAHYINREFSSLFSPFSWFACRTRNSSSHRSTEELSIRVPGGGHLEASR